MSETAVMVEQIIERYDNEKIILKFLICSNHYDKMICNKPRRKSSIF